MTNKKIVVGLALVSMLPIAASAATVDELQAQINALMAQLSAAKPATTASCVASFTKTLKQGMTDAEVMELQKLLNSDVATQVAASGVGSKGNETKYFGAATKAAVVKFQDKYAAEVLTPAGLSKGTGLVGAATRAKLNATCGTATTPSTTPATSTTLSGGAGTLTLTNYTSDVEDVVVTGDSEIVLSFKGKAEGSDIKVTHAKLTLTASSSAQSSYLNRYFTSFDVYAAGKKVGSVDAADFTRDSAGVYSKTVTLTDAVIKSGSSNQAVFTVKANAIASIDSDNIAQDWAIAATDVRYSDATGVILTAENVTATLASLKNTGVSVEKLASSSDVKVKVSSASTNPEEKTVFVSDDNSGDKVTLNEFKIKAEGTKVAFDTVKVSIVTVGATLPEIASELQLVKGDSVIDTVDTASSEYNGSVATFNLDNQQFINQDETVTYKIVAKVQKINVGNFTAGDSITASISSTVINAEDKNGDAITGSKLTGSASGKIQTLRATGINLVKVSSTADAVAATNSGAKGYGKFTFDVKVTASGDDLWIPLSASTTDVAATTTGMVYSVPAGTSTALLTRVSGGTDDNGSVKIADGETATLRLTVSLDPQAAGFAKLTVGSVRYALSLNGTTASIAATPTTDFETASIDIRP